MTKISSLGVTLVAGGLLVAIPALAQARPSAPATKTTAARVTVPLRSQPATPTPTYGTGVTSVHIVPGYDIEAMDGSAISHTAGGGGAGWYGRYSPTATEAEAPLRLPTGSLITSIEVQGCDNSTTDELLFVLWEGNSDGNYTVLSDIASTGTTAADGCGYWTLDLTGTYSPYTVDAYNHYYVVSVLTGATAQTSYTAVRAYYKLQVSPAPATATFPVDVPTTHPYFKFVEALAGAGITGGCGTGSYCPDQPLTRGQMAVFLSAALGLNWPN